MLGIRKGHNTRHVNDHALKENLSCSAGTFVRTVHPAFDERPDQVFCDRVRNREPSQKRGLQNNRYALVFQVLLNLADAEKAIVKHRRGQDF